MAMLSTVGMQLTNLTAYNEYITDVIIGVIVYLSAFALFIRTWISTRKKEAVAKPVEEKEKASQEEKTYERGNE